MRTYRSIHECMRSCVYAHVFSGYTNTNTHLISQDFLTRPPLIFRNNTHTLTHTHKHTYTYIHTQTDIINTQPHELSLRKINIRKTRILLHMYTYMYIHIQIIMRCHVTMVTAASTLPDHAHIHTSFQCMDTQTSTLHTHTYTHT